MISVLQNLWGKVTNQRIHKTSYVRGSISLSALMCGFNNRVERERREREETCSFSPVILSNVNLQQLSEDATAKHDVIQIFVQSKSDLPNLTASDLTWTEITS